MKKTLTLLALAIASTGSAMAAESPVYVSGGVGYSHASNTGASDHKGVSGTLSAGYDITPNVAVELGYTRLGDVKDSGVTAKLDALTLQAVGKTNVLNDKTSVFVKGGVAHTRGKVEGFRDTKYVPVVGFGAEYALNKNVSATAEVQYVHDFAGADVRTVNTSVGLKYHF